MAHSPEYEAWRNMKNRCYLPSYPNYKNWGGRGVRVCDDWLNSFQSFYDYIGPKPKGTYLDRIDNDGDYEPGNVRWATPQQQFLNRRRPTGSTQSSSPYRGVFMSNGKWVASITVDYRVHRSRPFATAKEAAIEWNKMATLYRGGDAILLDI